MNHTTTIESTTAIEAKARIEDALEVIRSAVSQMLAAGAGMQDLAADHAGLLVVAQVVDRVERTGHGLLLTVLARIDQAKAVKGGVGPWLTAQLGYQPGRGRVVAQDARRIGSLPELAEPLTTGRLLPGDTRVLARAVHAVRATVHDPARVVTDTLTILTDHGPQQAEEHVRTLEHTVDPGRAQDLKARQRARSFARTSELPEGMMRFDLLLDAERATTVRTAVDIQVSAWLRARQYDGKDLVPEDLTTTEQLSAHAFTRLAEVFLSATDSKRTEPYTPTVVYYAPAPQSPVQEPARTSAILTPRIPTGCARTTYGALIPLPALPTMHDPAAHLLTLDPTGHPITLDGQPIDQNPAARLATPAQRLALAYRDHHCTHPGCTRPTTWALHAHHHTPYSHQGPTTLANLRLYCAEHHHLAHSPAA
jgi:hypothetical protein